MKTLSFWKKSFYSALIFFGTLMVLSVGYAVWNGTMSQVSSGDSLTATKWNAFVDNINDINTRWIRVGSNIAFTGGNVGIGTASPLSKFDVNGMLLFPAPSVPANRPVLKIASPSNVWGGIQFNTNSVDQFYQYFDNTKFTIDTGTWTENPATAKFTVLTNGNVGIGTPSPSQKLDVNGKIGIHSTVTTSLIGNIRMEDNLFKIVTPSQKQWDFRDDGTIWFYNGSIWIQNL